MMKMTRLSLFPLLQAAGLALLLCACTSESTDEGLPEGTTPIRFQMPETRGVVNGAEDMKAFSVWGGYDNNTTNVFNGTEVRYEGNVWTYTGTQYWITGKNYDFYAVYPTNIEAKVSDDGTITISSFDATQGYDLMTASALNMKGSSPRTVAFTFGHELARVSFTVISEGDAVTITSAALIGADYQGTYIGGTWSMQQVSTESAPFTDGNISLTSEALSSPLFKGDLLLLPDNDISNAQLSLTYYYADAADPQKATLPLATTSVTQWEKGKGYQYNVTIPKDATDLSLQVTVNNWNSESTTIEW